MKTHGLDILVDRAEARRNKKPLLGEDQLASWIMERVDYWEEWRNTNYLQKWDEYYRIWRTEWSDMDRERMVERSRIMPTDLSEALGKVHAEMVDAFFGREVWFDVDDNVGDDQSEDVRQMATRLRDDADRWGVKKGLADAMFFGALYGTGICKLGVTSKQYARPTQLIDKFGRAVLSGATVGEETCLAAIPISPREFAIQPGALSIEDASGCAHITAAPLHHVLEGQRRGIYRKGDIGAYSGSWRQDPYSVEQNHNDLREQCKLVEYHGLVPKALLPGSKANAATKTAATSDYPSADVEMVEAIVVVCNDAVTLKAVENPYIPQRRAIFAFQHEPVPDAFFGRGVIEGGYHPYKALQTEIRARADGLALANYPTVWRNAASLSSDETRKDPDEKILKPGREYVIDGDPNRDIREFKFSGPDRGSSQAIADYQRMIEGATGSFGFQGALLSSKDTTIAGASMALQSFLRRSKQTAMNIETCLIKPVVEAMAWRVMQYIPEKYPPIDFKFSPKGAVGVLQRDAERATLIELIQALDPASPSFAAILRLIVEQGPNQQHTSQLLSILDAEIADRLTPKPPPPDPSGEARLISAQSREAERQDNFMLAMEELKRKDVDLLIKAKQGSGGSANDSQQKAADEVNININSGNKRVKIRRTDDGLVGETEEI